MTSSVDLAVVVPVHAGVRPSHLRDAFASVASQSVTPREVVVVVDGPVSADHDAAMSVLPGARVIRLPSSLGSGLARRRAIEECTSTWIGLVDSDDISEPHRFERQLQVLRSTGADVCTSAMLEFGSATAGDTVRGTPVLHEDFERLIPTRNPVNQPATTFRRDAYLAAGGYGDLLYLEDYDLWVRMMTSGARFVGVPEPLVRFRADGMLERRTSAEARRSERAFQRRLYEYGVVGPLGHLRNRVVRGTYLRMPRPLLRLAYRVVFHERRWPV